MKKNGVLRLFITGGIVAAGFLLMLYPFISNRMYERRQEQTISEYKEDTKNLKKDRTKQLWKEAKKYNKELHRSRAILTDPFDASLDNKRTAKGYYEVLNLYGDGMMGYVEIPAIEVYLPVFHGTAEEVLQKGVGHLENTSLPIGGKGTHAVLSAHTGLSDKKLFSDLEFLEKGDTFYLYILGQNLAYEVDNIQVVEPHEISSLYPVKGKDHVTLVTCTPYGINSHRLLVRGVRIPYEPEKKLVQEKKEGISPWMKQYAMAVGAGLMVLLLFGTAALIRIRRRK